MSFIEPYADSEPNRPQAAAGWYPLEGELGYWDGREWTEHRAPVTLPGQVIQARQIVHTYPAMQPHPMVITDSRVNQAETTIAWIFTVLTLGYMLPWAVAATRGKSNSWAVGLVNFLLGWTFFGWIAAFIMACMAHQVVGYREIPPAQRY